MENTIENKLKLFGANIGSQVEFEGQVYTLGGVILQDITINHNGDYVTINKGNVILSGDFSGIGNVGTSFVSVKSCKLLQTPLSAISDEDALEGLKIVKVYIEKSGAYITEFSPIEKIKKTYQDIPIWRLDIADYLRSKGFALPYMGLSVEQQISYGWIKLKTT